MDQTVPVFKNIMTQFKQLNSSKQTPLELAQYCQQSNREINIEKAIKQDQIMPGRKFVYCYVQETKDINYKEQNNVEVQTFKEISSVAV